jgi:hypothetical protein
MHLPLSGGPSVVKSKIRMVAGSRKFFVEKKFGCGGPMRTRIDNSFPYLSAAN